LLSIGLTKYVIVTSPASIPHSRARKHINKLRASIRCPVRSASSTLWPMLTTVKPQIS
jgi:hypothetical protein